MAESELVFPENIKDFILSKQERVRSNLFDKLSSDVPEMETAIQEYFLRGGKYVRPMLVYLGAYEAMKLNGNVESNFIDHIDSAVDNVASAVEILHNATLVYDDIEDKSKLRRDGPTLHEKYGVPLALNAGTNLTFKPVDAIINSVTNKSVDADAILKVLNLYSKMGKNITEGQHLDLLWSENDYIPTTNEYLDMIRGKTGVLMGFSIESGYAIITGEQNPKLREIGEAVGVVYQIIDDVISSFSNNTGKDIDGDLLEGKKTLPLILALDIYHDSDQTKHQELLDLYSQEVRNNSEVEIIRRLIKDSGAVGASLEYATAIINQAHSAYEFESQKVQSIVDSLINYVLNRSS